MTIEECYIKMGANYQDVIKRLPSVSMIEKFALKFREDMSFQELEKALNERLRGNVPKVSTGKALEISKEEFKKMSLAKQAELKLTKPNLYKELTKR